MKKTVSTTSSVLETFLLPSLDHQFENIFDHSAPKEWSEDTQKQAIRLLYRIQAVETSTLDLEHIVLPTETPEIPFGFNKESQASFLNTRLGLTQKMQQSLSTTFSRMKATLFHISPDNRPGFIARTHNGEKLELTGDIVYDRQDATSISPKYPQQVIVYDISARSYILDNFTAIDHADPWALIAGRVNTFLVFVNESPPPIKNKFITELLNNHPGYFILTGSSSGNVGATEFLASSLYNDPSNLVALNIPGNTSKNKRPFEVWVSTIPELEPALLESIATHPRRPFSSLLDKTGFIVKFRCDNSVHPDYHGAGLAEGLCALMGGDPSLSLIDKRKFAIHSIKNGYLLDTMDEHIRLVQLTKDTSELITIRDAFRHSLGKGIGTTEQRNRVTADFAKKLEEVTGIRVIDPRLAESPDTSDDEATMTKKELAKSKEREQEALQQKQEALQQKQEAIQRANDLATQLEKLQAKFADLEAAGLIQKEDA